MKATIKICRVGPFSDDQQQVIKRVMNVLTERGLSVGLKEKKTQSKPFKVKRA
jgi:hypothetical protein